MNIFEAKCRSILAGQVISVAGTLLMTAPASARHDEVTVTGGRRNASAAERLYHEAVRLQRVVHTQGEQNQRVERFTTPPTRIVEGPTTSVLDSSRGRGRSYTESHFINSNEKVRNLTRGLELDLTSNARSITLGENLFFDSSSYVVRSGDEDRVLSVGSQVSPAEFVALQQVITAGQQALVVDADGRGVDGQFALDSISTDGSRINAKSLVIPSSVDAIGDLSRSSQFRLTGDLVNNGNLLVNEPKSGASIVARDVRNAVGASISSMSDLSLAADRDFINDGSITSAGSLTISASRLLNNAGEVTSQADLEVVCSNVTNTGVISSGGSIKVNASADSDIYVNAIGGKFNASGDITVRDAGFANKVDTTVLGGEWLSENFNVFSGEGRVDINATDITGGVIVHAGTAAIHSAGPELTIRELVTTGDPLISSTGSIHLEEPPTTNGGPLSVVAGGSIQIHADELSTVSLSGGDGGDLVLIAGADFTVNANDIQITGASAQGGEITWFESPPTLRTSSSSNNAGDVLIVSFNSNIQLAGVNIVASGGSGRFGGNVTMIAPGGVSIANVDTVGTQNSAPGDLLFSGSQPLISGTFTIDKVSGAVTSGSIVPGSGAASVGTSDLKGDHILVSGSLVGVRDVIALSELTLFASARGAGAHALTTPILNLNVESTLSWINDANNNIGVLNATGAGTFFLTNGPNDLQINSLGANQSIEATSYGTITIGGDIATTGNITFNTASVINEHSLTANSIHIVSPSGAIVVDGGAGGTFEATGADEKVLVGTWLGSITLEGTLNFGSEAEFTISSSSNTFRVAAGADVTGLEAITVNARTVDLNGSIEADPLVINYDFIGGTIMNTQGDIVLTGPVIMNGGNLAIISGRNITSTGSLTLNTSSATGDAGTVLIWAGIYSIPGVTTITDTPGQIVDSFISFNPTPSYLDRDGDVLLANVDIDASSTNGRGGNVTIATTKGTITIGDINTSGTTDAGSVQIYGMSGVTVSSITALGGTGGNDGDIDVRATGMATSSTMQILNGTVSGFDLIPFTGAPFGPVTIGSVDAGNAKLNILATGISMSGAFKANNIKLTALDSLVAMGSIDAGLGELNVDATNILMEAGVTANLIRMTAIDTLDLTNVVGDVVAQQDVSGNGGQIFLQAKDIIFSSSNGNPLVLNADGTGAGNGGSITFLDTHDSTPTYVGTVAKPIDGSQFLEISAKSGTGFGANAGYVLLETGGDITVNTDGFSAAAQGTGPSNGAQYRVHAGANLEDGELVIVGDLRADGLNGGFGGIVSLQSHSKKEFAVNSTKIPKNGISGLITAHGAGGEISIENVFGDIEVRTSQGLQASTVKLYTGDGESTKTNIVTSKGAVITADSIVLEIDGKAAKGDKTIMINARELTAFSVGKGNIENVGSASFELLSVQFAKGFELLSSSPLVLSSIQTNGDIDIVSTKGSITLIGDPLINGAAVINAINGDVTLRSTDVVDGSIILGINSQIQTSDHGGNITIAIGEGKNKPVSAASPVNVTVSKYGKGKVSFAPRPDVVEALAPSTIIAGNRSVLLSSSSSQKITFEGGNLVSARDSYYNGSNFSAMSDFADASDSPQTSRTLAAGGLEIIHPQSAFAIVGNKIAMQTDNQNVYASLNPKDFVSNSCLISNSVRSKPTTVDSSASGGLTHAYVWSDDDYGLDERVMLRSNEPARDKRVAEVAHLRKGVVVLAPSRDTQLRTPLGDIDVLKGSIALVVLDNSRLAVYDLHDASKNSVRISTTSKSIVLSPGHCTILTRNAHHDFERVNPMEAVGYKSLDGHLCGSELRAFSAEFSVLSAINAVHPLRSLVASSHPNAKRMSSSLMKTSAILMHLGDSQAFKRYAAPSMVASRTH